MRVSEWGGNLESHAKLTHMEAVPPVMAVMVVHRVGAPGTADIVGAGASRLAAGLVDVEGVIVTAGLALAVGFALFRLFDIVKPWPIGWLDKHVDGGLGIMLDDIAAGLITALLMAALRVAGWL